jgi:hypothetical protein
VRHVVRSFEKIRFAASGGAQLAPSLDQAVPAQFSEHIAWVAAGPAFSDQPALAIAKRQGSAPAVVDWAAAAPPTARTMRSAERNGSFGSSHGASPLYARVAPPSEHGRLSVFLRRRGRGRN